MRPINLGRPGGARSAATSAIQLRFSAKLRKGHRRANAIIEMAIVFQVLLWLAMGMAEFGQYFYIKTAFQSAARDACRAAVLATSAQTDPTTAATRTLGFANVTFNSSWMTIQDITSTPVTVTNCSTVAAGHTLEVTITVNYDQIPNVYRPLYQMTGQGIKNGKPMVGQCTMVRE